MVHVWLSWRERVEELGELPVSHCLHGSLSEMWPIMDRNAVITFNGNSLDEIAETLAQIVTNRTEDEIYFELSKKLS